MIPKVKNHQDCANKASENEKAKFWTYQPSTKKCWIKTSKAGRKTLKKNTLVSGNVECACVIEEKTDYLGNDIKMIPNVKNHQDCAKKAAENEKAKFWTYQPSKKKCWIKTSKAGKRTLEKNVIVSGNAECGQ